ncbi:MAG: DUF72 domain-containing protein [Candidatus Aminicenantes bacterium]|nr:DUF72 domain-containing protein [Candidatus Aminicenantes bacterium]
MGELRIGTCSWKYYSWRGIVYPQEGEYDYLEEYAQRFDTVEIDQWFWSLFDEKVVLPQPDDVERYAAAVPADFRFTVKAPNSLTLTHHYSRDMDAPLNANPHFLSPSLYRDFLARLEPLKDKVGLVMLQFEYLNKRKMAAQAEFLEKLEPFLESRPRDLPLAVECRNPRYLDEAYFRFLRRHDVHHVFCQGYYMPLVWEIEAKRGDLLTGTSVVRLMGANRKGIESRSGERWNAIVDAKDDELAAIVPMLQRLRRRLQRVYVNINNHYEGSAPLTVAKLKGLLADSTA